MSPPREGRQGIRTTRPRRQSSERTPADDEGDGQTRLVAMWRGGYVSRVLRGGEVFIVGRDPTVELQVDDPSVSRRHAQLRFDEELGAVVVTDLGSRNGMRIGGRSVQAGMSVQLHAGHLVELGDAMLVLQAPRRPETVEVESSEPSMLRIERLLERVAPSQVSVVLLGETGVGKGRLAQRLHALSNRRDKPFVPIHCAALPESLFEAELFGYERGAFTGATVAKPGLFEQAHLGTLFLDEVGEIPLSLQAKLLRAIEQREVLRLGATRARPIDVRIVSATNRDLYAMVADGRFRGDLFYRMTGLELTIPALRDRPSELVVLIKRFVEEAAVALGRVPPRIHPDAMAALRRHQWPGNVRELKNVIDCAVLLADTGLLGLEQLPGAILRGASVVERPQGLEALQTPLGAAGGSAVEPAVERAARSLEPVERVIDDPVVAGPLRSGASGAGPLPLGGAMGEVPLGGETTGRMESLKGDDLTSRSTFVETDVPPRSSVEEAARVRVRAALSAASGNQTRAAALLGISRRTLIYQMERLGISGPRKQRDR